MNEKRKASQPAGRVIDTIGLVTYKQDWKDGWMERFAIESKFHSNGPNHEH